VNTFAFTCKEPISKVFDNETFRLASLTKPSDDYPINPARALDWGNPLPIIPLSIVKASERPVFVYPLKVTENQSFN